MTGLSQPRGLAVDAAGLLYVSADATGNRKPIRTVTGAATQLSQPTSIALDAQGGTYVSDLSPSSITHCLKTANGNAAPTGQRRPTTAAQR